MTARKAPRRHPGGRRHGLRAAGDVRSYRRRHDLPWAAPAERHPQRAGDQHAGVAADPTASHPHVDIRRVRGDLRRRPPRPAAGGGGRRDHRARRVRRLPREAT